MHICNLGICNCFNLLLTNLSTYFPRPPTSICLQLSIVRRSVSRSCFLSQLCLFIFLQHRILLWNNALHFISSLIYFFKVFFRGYFLVKFLLRWDDLSFSTVNETFCHSFLPLISVVNENNWCKLIFANLYGKGHQMMYFIIIKQQCLHFPN